AVVQLIAPDGTGMPSQDSFDGAFEIGVPQTALAEPGEWRAVEAALARDADERFRRIALAALVAQAHSPAGWTDELRTRLAACQADSSPLVAAAAAFTFPPPIG